MKKHLYRIPIIPLNINFLIPFNLAGLGEFEKALNAINELLDKKPPKNSTSLKACSIPQTLL